MLYYEMNVNEKKFFVVSKMVEFFFGICILFNKFLIGENVFIQMSGIYVDGDNKNNFYFNDLYLECFDCKCIYVLGKLVGKVSIKKNLDELGIELDIEFMCKFICKINELGDWKEVVI